MTRLVWGETNQRRYEAGVERGVLYPSDGKGVVWNGLVSVDESFVGGDTNAFYFDGIKYLETVSPRNYQATLTAFSAPAEFSHYIGNRSIIPGLFLTRQTRERFGLSYRTKIGDGPGYKIHLVYNVLASPNGKAHSTLNDTTSAEPITWQVDAVPLHHVGDYKPAAHFIFDSTKMSSSALEFLESLIYGTEEQDAKLPSIDELLDFLVDWTPLVIIPHPVTGLSDLQLGDGDLYETQVSGINRAQPTSRLHQSLTNGFYTLEIT